MKKKTFFTTQFMFLLFFNGAVLLLSVMLWKEKLEIQKEMALSEHYMILSSVMRDMQAEGGDGYDAAKLMEPYTRYRKDKRRALYLYRGEQLLYSDVDDREIFDMEKQRQPKRECAGSGQTGCFFMWRGNSYSRGMTIFWCTGMI